MKTYTSRRGFDAQKRTTKYCGHTCATRVYKVRKRNELDIEINFEDFVKRQLNQQTILLNQLKKTMEKILSFQKINSQEILTPDEYCQLKGIKGIYYKPLNHKISIKIEDFINHS